MKPSPNRFCRLLLFPAAIIAGSVFISSTQAADLLNTATTGGTYGNAQFGYAATAPTSTVGAGSSLVVGSGSSNYMLVGVGYNGAGGTGTLNMSAANSFTANVGNLYVGICAFNNPVSAGAAGSGSVGTGTLNLSVNNTITASTKFVIGGGDAEANTGMAGGSVGLVTTAANGTTTIYTPVMQLGTAKGNTGTFTLGSNSTLNLGTTSNRTALSLGIKLTDFNGANRTVAGTMNLGAAGGVADLNLSSLRLSYNTIHMGGGSLDGTLTLSNSASNKLNIIGAGNVVAIGVASGTAGSFGSGTAKGLLTIGNLHADSYIESTDNGTAILIGAKPSGALASIQGTMDFKAGTLTIKTTGAAIAGGAGTANVSTLNLGETGNVTLIAGADSSDWIKGLTVAEIKSGGATIDTNSKAIGVSQAFSGAGGLTKDGLGTLTLSGIQTYTGATNVNNGTLILDGASTATTGALTVAGGACLGGNGSTPAAVTVQANGKLLENISDWADVAGTGFTDLAVGALTFDGAWTLDVSSLTSYANFIDADTTFTFLNATSISGFVPANVTVVANGFTGSGTWSVRKVDNSLQLVYTGTGGFAGWAGDWSGPALSNQAPDADPDGDGLVNAIEYVLGSDPRYPNTGGPTSEASGSNLIFAFSRTDASETPDVSLKVEVSNDLSDWTTLPSYNIGSNTGGSSEGVVIEENDDAADRITVTIPKGSNVKLFARLRALVTE